MNVKPIVKQSAYRFSDYFKPRWIVLDARDSYLWTEKFWTYRGAAKACKKVYG